jgi:hypothetical protein
MGPNRRQTCGPIGQLHTRQGGGQPDADPSSGIRSATSPWMAPPAEEIRVCRGCQRLC